MYHEVSCSLVVNISERRELAVSHCPRPRQREFYNAPNVRVLLRVFDEVPAVVIRREGRVAVHCANNRIGVEEDHCLEEEADAVCLARAEDLEVGCPVQSACELLRAVQKGQRVRAEWVVR